MCGEKEVLVVSLERSEEAILEIIKQQCKELGVHVTVVGEAPIEQQIPTIIIDSLSALILPDENVWGKEPKSEFMQFKENLQKKYNKYHRSK